MKSIKLDDDTLIVRSNCRTSVLDETLIQSWTQANANGSCSFHFDRSSISFRSVPGKWSIHLQLNVQRARTKRSTQTIDSLQAKSNRNSFNFTQIDSKEKLFDLHYPNDPNDRHATLSSAGTRVASVIINSSPFDWYSSLLVPDCDLVTPQLLKGDSLTVALLTICSSAKANILVGFNSVGGNASVNHCHWHIAYLSQTSPLSRLSGHRTNLARIDWIVNTIAIRLSLQDAHVSNIWRLSTLVCEWLDTVVVQQLQLAYNVVLLREADNEREGESVRICIWIRKPNFDLKSSGEINPGICEFAGLFQCRSECEFDAMTERDCVALMQKWDADEQLFRQAFEQLQAMWTYY
jgi:hypothetical protein